MTHQVCTSPSTSIYRIGVLRNTVKSFLTEATLGIGELYVNPPLNFMKTHVYLCCLPPFPCLTLRKGPPRSRDDGPNGRARHLVPGRMSKVGVVAKQIPQD